MEIDHEMKVFVVKFIPLLHDIFDLRAPPADETYVTFSGDMTEEMVTLLLKAIWTKCTYCFEKWEDYFMKFKTCMQDSPSEYARCVLYACDVVHKNTPNIFECVLDVFSVITTLVVLFNCEVHKLFAQHTPLIYTTYFNVVLKKPFYRCGGWRRFGEYISKQKYIKCLKEFDSLEKTLEGFEDADRMEEIFKDMSSLKDLPYDPNEISSKEINNHMRTMYLLKLVLPRTANEDFLRAKQNLEKDKPIIIQNSLRKKGRLAFYKSILTGFSISSSRLEENKDFVFENCQSSDPLESVKNPV
ncbi:hypothetical protein CDAR_315311 [Caerostris darwini]|uniref:Uncharacterized protein n=1 Tax=Caerostris darwini TaxID=1538125 RepID=A0AAV4QNV2_9ARAC|nr:hypothetical protein CDAR_315311 [Caerostris darwini]